MTAVGTLWYERRDGKRLRDPIWCSCARTTVDATVICTPGDWSGRFGQATTPANLAIAEVVWMLGISPAVRLTLRVLVWLLSLGRVPGPARDVC